MPGLLKCRFSNVLFYCLPKRTAAAARADKGRLREEGMALMK